MYLRYGIYATGNQQDLSARHTLNYFSFPESSECFLLLLSLCLCISRIRRHSITHRVLYTEKQINQLIKTPINESHKEDGLSIYQTLNDEHYGKPKSYTQFVPVLDS
jgi:hypothetical protein